MVKSLGETPMTGFHAWHYRVVGMRSLISCMTRNIPYRIALFIWNVIGTHVHFRWGVALVGEFFY